MKILFVSTSDSSGGAAIACLRLVEALRAQGHPARVLVMEKRRMDSWIQAAPDAWPQWSSLKKHLTYFVQQKFVANTGYQYTGIFKSSLDVASHPWVQEADVLCLHWINHGFLAERALEGLFSLRKPIVWHMHDFWAFTGGCHYPGSCGEFRRECENCMALKQPFKSLAIAQLQSRIRTFGKQSPTLVGASQWLADQAKASALGAFAKVVHIPNPLDPDFKPLDKAKCREVLQLKPNKRYILFAAMNIADVRKGFHLLKEALKLLDAEQVGCLVAGKFKAEQLAEIPLEVRALGPLNKEGMMQAYNAADVFVIPSLEENLPNTVLESLSCGTPVAGFAIGGIPEMVSDGQTGFLSKELTNSGLATAIKAALDLSVMSDCRIKCTNSLEAYLPERVAESYFGLFRERVIQK